MKMILITLLPLLLTVSFANGQNQWTFVSTFPLGNPRAYSVSVVDQNVIWVACDGSAVFRTVNGGLNWTLGNTGLTSVHLGISALDSMNCWVGTVDGSIYRTTNGGLNWTLQIAVSGSFIDGIKMFNQNYGVFFGDPVGEGEPYQFRTTSNGGTNWVLVPNAPIARSNEFAYVNAWDWTDSNHFWIGGAYVIPDSSNAKLFYTSNGFWGTWLNTILSGIGGNSGFCLSGVAFVDNNNGLVGSHNDLNATNGGAIFKTTNGGATFSNITPPAGMGTFGIRTMTSVKTAGIIRMAIDTGGGSVMWRTTNLGTSWIQETIPVQAAENTINDMEFLNENLGFAVLGYVNPIGGFMRYGPPIGINPVGNEIPKEFKLGQNYPNPFNPGTTIKFAIPKAKNVILKVYDILGKEVEILVSEFMAAGNYSVFYDAARLPSGVYFYRLTAGDYTDTKKMILVK